MQHAKGIFGPWPQGSSQAENHQEQLQQLLQGPVPAPDCSCLFLLPVPQHHRMAEVGRPPLQTTCSNPCSSRATQSRLPRTTSRWFLKISMEGKYKNFLGSLCQRSITHTVKKCFLMFRWNLLCSGLCPSPLVHSDIVSCPALSCYLCFIHLPLSPACSPPAPGEGQALVMIMRGCYWHRLCPAALCLLANMGKVAVKGKELTAVRLA